MSVTITAAELGRIGMTRMARTAALECCLVRVRRGLYVVRADCADPEHEALRRLGGCDAVAGPHTDPTMPPVHGQSSARLPTHNHEPPEQIRADFAALDATGLRAHAAKLRILARTYTDVLAPDCALSHISAALLWGMPLTRPITRRVEVIRTTRSRTYSNCVIRKREFAQEEVTRLDGLRVTAPLRTLIDVARDYPLDVSVPMIDHCLRERLVAPQTLTDALEASSSFRGRRRARDAIGVANPLHESPAESICAVRFHEYGIEGFEPQVRFRVDADGTIARVDFFHRATKLIVEVNGEIKYTGGASGERRARLERQREFHLRSLGHQIFHLTWKDLFASRHFHTIRAAVSTL